MTVLLVLATFLTFLLIDYFSGRKPVVVRTAAAVESRPAHSRVTQSLVGGFSVPEKLRYHPGHTWAIGETPTLVRIGMDEFASKLTGKLERIALPQRGKWIRQGQKIWTLYRNGASVDMVSPIEGSIVDINEAAMSDPEVARKDPYGEGWLVTVQSPDAKTNFRNLLGGAMARWWTEESASRLQRRMPVALGALAQDGGVAMDSLADQLPDQDWTTLTKEFFLS
jgi:glycine cleavage system H lipoate-binding protein